MTDAREEILRCAKDFGHCAQYFKIVTKRSKLESFRPNDAQKDLIKSISRNDNLMMLKARQLGSTTGIAAYFFWKALFNPHINVAVVAHTDEAVKKIFEIYRMFYDELPEFLKLETVRARENQLKFVTGSSIRIGSASSQSFRGGTYQLIHASEYAFWGNMEETIASLFSTATETAKIVLESTANGMNEAYDMWSRDNGFTKLFLSWKMDRDYALDDASFSDPTEEELEYSYENKLNQRQLNWAVKTLRTKCANNWNIFNQEFPARPEDAFIQSGSPFFPMKFDVINATPGYEEFQKPKKFGIYLMGVDTASGSPGGDYSAFMILDATEPKSIRMVASFYERIPPSLFSKHVLTAAKRYHALAVVETNSYGLSIHEHLQQEGYHSHYRTTSFDKVTNGWRNQLGFQTTVKTRPLLFSRLYEYVSRGWVKPDCPRFQAEANRLHYNSRGKVEASSGQHDDMVMATGLALMGLDQVDEITEEVEKSYKPRSIREILEWEAHTGKLWKDVDNRKFANDSQFEVQSLFQDV
tara:strand:- start:12767 stop:14347 length:1581 start_codon:yes stop_codon:yes gene_type:complete